MLLAHCRASTFGNEKYNKNNHPHTSNDKRIALIHNGKVTEYGILKSRYELSSDCDSEILLRMFEAGESYRNKEEFLKKEFSDLSIQIHQLMGLREIFSRIQYGAMAVAIGERGDGLENHSQRHLWLFRDEERPIFVIDMRKTLGQIFFCSEMEIWRSALESCPELKHYFVDHPPIMEFPAWQAWRLFYDPKTPEEIETLKWKFLYEAQAYDSLKEKYQTKKEIPAEEWKDSLEKAESTKSQWEDKITEEEMLSARQKTEWTYKRFRIIKTKFYDYDKNQDNSKVVRPKGSPVTKITTRLDKDEDIEVKHTVSKATVSSSTKTTVVQTRGSTNDYSSDSDYLEKSQRLNNQDIKSLNLVTDYGEIDMAAFDDMVADMRRIVSDIDTNVKNLQQEKTLTEKDFHVIMESLKDAATELKASMLFLNDD